MQVAICAGALLAVPVSNGPALVVNSASFPSPSRRLLERLTACCQMKVGEEATPHTIISAVSPAVTCLFPMTYKWHVPSEPGS